MGKCVWLFIRRNVDCEGRSDKETSTPKPTVPTEVEDEDDEEDEEEDPKSLKELLSEIKSAGMLMNIEIKAFVTYLGYCVKKRRRRGFRGEDQGGGAQGGGAEA